MMTARSSLWLLLALSLGAPVLARYASEETALVPVTRLIENLRAQLERSPESARLWHSLARVHATAYSSKRAELAAVDGPAGPTLWSHPESPNVPFREVVEASDDAVRAEASKHLDEALRCFERSLELAPGSAIVMLGHAWCLEQRGERARARDLYREVIRLAWEHEQKGAQGTRPFVVAEAAGYLLPLLDPVADQAEAEDLRAKVAHLALLPRMVTPLAIPLEPGLEPAQLIERERPVTFDLDGSGRRLRWSWITPRAAWLVWDPARRGRIDSAIWLFGGRSFLLFCQDGFEALSLLDDDHDGQVRGDELLGLSLWHDVDGDGVSDEGEVRPLEAFGITALSCRATRHPTGILYAPAGVLLADGSSRPCFDLVLERHPAD
jgi:hypothetical protein